MVVARGWGADGKESYTLMGMEFQFNKTKSMEMGGGDDCTLWMYL